MRQQSPVVLPGGPNNALLARSSTEGSYEGAILATQEHYVGVRLVQVVGAGKRQSREHGCGSFRPAGAGRMRGWRVASPGLEGKQEATLRQRESLEGKQEATLRQRERTLSRRSSA